MQAYVDMMNFSNMDFLKVSCTVTLSSNRPFQKSNVHFRIVDFRIFLPLTSFFMKTILEIVEVQKLPFFQFQRLWILVFGTFQHSKIATIHQNQTSVPLKISKYQFLHFQIPYNWFHIKSKSQKDAEISTQCNQYLFFFSSRLWDIS